MRTIKRTPEVLGAIAALVLAGGCGSLDVSNPNAPDTPHLLANPASIQALAEGAMRTWFTTLNGGGGADQYPVLTMGVMARSHVAMWNNYHIRYYTGCTNAAWDTYTPATNGTCGPFTEGPAYPRAAWANNSAAAERTQIEAIWYGDYAALSSARDVLRRIRNDNVVIDGAANTKMVETMALLVQGLALSELSLNYDRGFIVDYYTDLTTLSFQPAVDVRDAALAKFDTVIINAGANTFSTADGFFGAGVTYSNTQVAQIANTMAARTLAYFPRNAAENATVDWARVVNYASQGISSGAAFDWSFHQDACVTWCDNLKVWSNDMTTMRVHTRVVHMMDATEPDPWDITQSVIPTSADKRLGNGAWRGDSSYAAAVTKSHVDPVNGGTDYVYAANALEFGNKTRGSWHQSAVGQIRYDSFPGCGDNPNFSSSPGDLDGPIVLAAENDLLWAEGLIRGPAPDLATAATHINVSRVGRGGLLPATAADANLLGELQYEQDVELLGSNPAPFYNQRRIDKLEPNTPHEMPVPAKELGVLGFTVYTCGGDAHPDGSCDPGPGPVSHALVAALVTDAPRVWAQMQEEWRRNVRLHGFSGHRQY